MTGGRQASKTIAAKCLLRAFWTTAPGTVRAAHLALLEADNVGRWGVGGWDRSPAWP